MSRPSWIEYFAKIAELTSKRSNCIRKQVGCIIVKDNRIISTGYNGTPSGMKNCFDGGCERCYSNYLNNSFSGSNLDLCICLHAEENAMLSPSISDMTDGTLYCTHFPCISCTKKIIQCKIKKVVYINNYSDTLEKISKSMFETSNIIVEQYIF
jgi:dCMP deaminase